MFFKKLGAATLAALAISALSAGISQAGVWEVGTTKFANGQEESAKSSLIGTAEFTSKVLGQNLKVTIKKVVKEKTKKKQHFGFISTHDVEKEVFEETITHEPAGCKVASFTTNALRGSAQMGNTAETASSVYIHYTPESGEVFGSLKLTECAAAGTYQLKGDLFVKDQVGTGVLATAHRYDSSAAINASQGGALLLGKEPAALTLSESVELSGANAGKEWRLTEN